MSVQFPVYVNDELVGNMTVTRVIKPLPPGNAEDDWRNHEYRWEATVYEAGHFTRRLNGRVYHRPCEGIWKLIAAATGAVPGWAVVKR